MKNDQVTRTYVENVDGIAALNGQFDTAAETKIFYGNKSHPQDIEKYKGIFNMGTGKFVIPVSKKYQLIQHNDVVESIVTPLKRLGMEVKGLVVNCHDAIKMDLVFTNQGVPIKDDATGVMLGIRIVNSYNKTSSLRFEMFAFRTICKNGMSFGNIMGVRSVETHYGNQEKKLNYIMAVAEKFIKEVVNSSDKLQKYVDVMMADSEEWQNAVQIVNHLVQQEKHRKQILSRIEGNDNLTRWDLYNALTNYITHDEHLTPHVQTVLENKSRKLMTTNFSKLMEEVIEAEVPQ